MFIGPFEVLEKIGELAYRIALSPKLSNIHGIFHVSMLRKYQHDLTHILDFETIEVGKKIKYVEKPVQVLDRREQILKNKGHFSRQSFMAASRLGGSNVEK